MQLERSIIPCFQAFVNGGDSFDFPPFTDPVTCSVHHETTAHNDGESSSAHSLKLLTPAVPDVQIQEEDWACLQ